ncbi:hypothetical protein PLESTB_000075600 [Pleodorina starrii]|uniref:Uncharacterized protein n=1 Tax=Pleodorina starrii TaxID=330485 RepID=A0A9W6EX24_9CHLO|nr:hypothetical protein PLESTM_000071200 [Pleodorina starrii]GLC48252.1 hypothetical protein PLESTB_000075600 [Pleodorina starrii]GLC66541.1 hypothetical protein PLESTF_000441800 [Pleodorina starrii]
MAFLQRIASGFKEGLVSLTYGGEAPRKHDAPLRTISKQGSRGKRPSSISFGFLEAHIRDAIAAFVQDKFDKGEAKPHVFTQFWLQFPKLEAGFEVLRQQLESRTGSRDGSLPLAVLASSPQDFGIDESSEVVKELCGKAASQKCTDIDFVGLVMLLLVVHLTEPGPASGSLHPDVHTMLLCLELAFTHFNSARRGKLDKREVAEALQYESAKAHMKEGARGRTSNRLAHRLFEGLDWEHDNTISFENFLRGILQLVQDEFGDVPEEEEEEDVTAAGAGGGGASGGTSGPSSPPLGSADAARAAGGTPPRRCGSSRVDSSNKEGSYGGNRPRSASTTGMTSNGSPTAPGTTGSGQAQEPMGRSPGSFLASLRNSLRKSTDRSADKLADTAQEPPAKNSA